MLALFPDLVVPPDPKRLYVGRIEFVREPGCARPLDPPFTFEGQEVAGFLYQFDTARPCRSVGFPVERGFIDIGACEYTELCAIGRSFRDCGVASAAQLLDALRARVLNELVDAWKCSSPKWVCPDVVEALSLRDIDGGRFRQLIDAAFRRFEHIKVWKRVMDVVDRKEAHHARIQRALDDLRAVEKGAALRCDDLLLLAEVAGVSVSRRYEQAYRRAGIEIKAGGRILYYGDRMSSNVAKRAYKVFVDVQDALRGIQTTEEAVRFGRSRIGAA